jgi:TonB family protein
MAMKPLFILVALILGSHLLAQSGRKAPKAIPQTPPPVEETKPPETRAAEERLPVTAERNEDYLCTDDGSLARILQKDIESEKIFSAKSVDARAVIIDKPRPSYTKAASRAGVQGYVILKVMLSSTGEIGRVRVVRRLPFGLTENAIRVACKIKFKPAVKDGQQVSQWLDVDYAFRMADSSIYRRWVFLPSH